MSEIKIIDTGKCKRTKLIEVTKILEREKLNENEQWMFNNYYDNPSYEFRKDGLGKLQVHRMEVSNG